MIVVGIREGGWSLVLLFVASLWGAGALAGQVTSAGSATIASGFSLALGAGPYAVRDEYISSGRYTGTLSYLRAAWTHADEGKGYRVGFGYGNSSEIANHSVSSDITHAGLDIDYFHRVGRFRFLSRRGELFLGPSGGFSLYVNQPAVSGNAFDLIVSFAALLSAGVNAQAVLPVSDRLHVTGTLRTAVLSLGLRMVDLVEDDESPVGLLTPFNGLNATTGLDVRYSLSSHLSLGVGCELAVLRIRSWDEVASAGNDFFVQLTVSP